MTKPSLWTFQICGIDTLDLGLYVDWNNWKWLERQLTDAKVKARLSKRDGALIDLGVSDMLALPGGKPPMYQYGLATPSYRLWIAARGTPDKYPNVYVSPSAQGLWFNGMAPTIDAIRHDIETIGGTVEAVRVSRVDLCADFLIPDGLSADWLEYHRVSRAQSITQHSDGSTLQTFHVCRGRAPIQLRIYDKSAEIEHSGKDWFRSLWPSGPIAGVWRFEFQVRRAALRQFKIDSPVDLKDSSASLWHYLTTKWFSLRLNDNEHTSRRSVCLLWQDVQNVADRFPGALEVTRASEAGLTDVKRIVRQVLGYTKTYAARKRVTDLGDALRRLFSEIVDTTTPKDFAEAVQKRAIQFGIHLDGDAGALG